MKNWEEIRENIKSISEEEKEIIKLQAKLQAEQQAHNDLREKLKEIEWFNTFDHNGNEITECPYCHIICWSRDGVDRSKTQQHEEDCFISQAIKGDSK